MEYKFKAWDKIKKKWIGGNSTEYLCINHDVVVLVEYAPNSFGSWSPKSCRQLTWEETDDLEIVMSIGLKDKNGKEIYEEDIIRWSGYGYTPAWIGKVVKVIDEESPNKIIYGLWRPPNNLFLEESISYNIWELKNMEVVGNNLENPELIYLLSK